MADVTQIKGLIESAQSVLIVVPKDHTTDHLAAGLSLHFGLKKLDKDIRIVSPAELMVEHNRLIGIDQVKNELGGRNLVISFVDQQLAIDKVYPIDNPVTGCIDLIVEPQSGAKTPDHRKVTFGYKYQEVDLAICVGTARFEDFGHMAEEIQSIFKGDSVLTLSNQNIEGEIIGHAFVNQSAFSVSEVVYRLLIETGMQIDSDMATNLLAGIEYRTDNLTAVNITAETLEIVASCLRYGGIRGYTEVEYRNSRARQDDRGQVETDETQIEEVQKGESNVELVDMPIMQVQKNMGKESIGNGAHETVLGNIPDWMMPKLFSAD